MQLNLQVEIFLKLRVHCTHKIIVIQYEIISYVRYIYVFFSGRIETGMKIIANISKVETDSGDRPTDDVRILKARIIED